MSERMKAIKRRLKEQPKPDPTGYWVRRGECKRCGACCDARNIDPEGYKRRAAEYLEKRGEVLSSICANHHVMPGGQLGCVLHDTDRYPKGCADFPWSVEVWRPVMATCGYWFEWVEKGTGKARRRARA